MARQAEAGATRRRAALAVLTTGIVGDPLAERIALTLVGRAANQPSAALLLDEHELAQARQLAEDHRVKRLLDHLVPSFGSSSVTTLAGAMAIERHLLEVVELLANAGVAVLVLKGNATAYLDHADPSDREVGDIDLLVMPERLATAMAALGAAGWLRSVTHPFATPTFFHSETFVHPDGTEIDLHHRLAQPSRSPRSCWAAPDTFVLGGATLQALPRHWRFLHALIHQMMNPPPSHRALNGLIDLTLMWTAGVDVEAVRAAGREIGMPELTERGLARVAGLLGEASLPVRRPRSRSGSTERKLAAALDTDRPTPGYLALAANLAVQPRRRWPSYLRQLVWPSPAYREQMGITLGGQLRHVAREAVGR